MGQNDIKLVQKVISDATTDLKQYINQRQREGFEDMKQYIDQRQREGFEDMKQYVHTSIEASEKRLSAQIKDLSISIGTALDISNAENQVQLDGHEARITKLEKQAA